MLLLDAMSGTVLRRHGVGSNPQPGLFAGAALWVPNHGESSLSVISVEGGNVRTEPTGRYPSAILLVGRDVWVTEFGDGTVMVLRNVT